MSEEGADPFLPRSPEVSISDRCRVIKKVIYDSIDALEGSPDVAVASTYQKPSVTVGEKEDDSRTVVIEGGYIGRAYMASHDLTYVHFDNVYMCGVICRGADFDHAQFNSANLGGADFRGASLQNVVVRGPSDTLQDADFRNANLMYATLEGVELPEAQWLGGANLTGMSPKAEFAGALEHLTKSVENAGALTVSVLVAMAFVLLSLWPATRPADHRVVLPVLGMTVPVGAIAQGAFPALYAMFFVYMLQLHRTWGACAGLPAVLCDGVRIDRRVPPWLLGALVRWHMPVLRVQSGSDLLFEVLLAYGLAYVAVPFGLCIGASWLLSDSTMPQTHAATALTFATWAVLTGLGFGWRVGTILSGESSHMPGRLIRLYYRLNNIHAIKRDKMDAVLWSMDAVLRVMSQYTRREWWVKNKVYIIICILFCLSPSAASRMTVWLGAKPLSTAETARRADPGYGLTYRDLKRSVQVLPRPDGGMRAVSATVAGTVKNFRAEAVDVTVRVEWSNKGGRFAGVASVLLRNVGPLEERKFTATSDDVWEPVQSRVTLSGTRSAPMGKP